MNSVLSQSKGIKHVRVKRTRGILPRIQCEFDECKVKLERTRNWISQHNRLNAVRASNESCRQLPPGKAGNQSEKMNHQKRIDIVYYSVIHKLSLRHISRIVDVPFSTVRQTINDYINDNRTNNLVNIAVKAKMLEERSSYQQIMLQRKERIDARRLAAMPPRRH